MKSFLGTLLGILAAVAIIGGGLFLYAPLARFNSQCAECIETMRDAVRERPDAGATAFQYLALRRDAAAALLRLYEAKPYGMKLSAAELEWKELAEGIIVRDEARQREAASK